MNLSKWNDFFKDGYHFLSRYIPKEEITVKVTIENPDCSYPVAKIIMSHWHQNVDIIFKYKVNYYFNKIPKEGNVSMSLDNKKFNVVIWDRILDYDIIASFGWGDYYQKLKLELDPHKLNLGYYEII